jgi:hypothetical protein
MTVLWSNRLSWTPRPLAALSFLTRRRRNPCKARSLVWVPVIAAMMVSLQAMDVKVGDVVLYGKWSGTEIKIAGDDVLIMRESDIMGVID